MPSIFFALVPQCPLFYLSQCHNALYFICPSATMPSIFFVPVPQCFLYSLTTLIIVFPSATMHTISPSAPPPLAAFAVPTPLRIHPNSPDVVFLLGKCCDFSSPWHVVVSFPENEWKCFCLTGFHDRDWIFHYLVGFLITRAKLARISPHNDKTCCNCYIRTIFLKQSLC